jgi:D-serine dehydratase
VLSSTSYFAHDIGIPCNSTINLKGSIREIVKASENLSNDAGWDPRKDQLTKLNSNSLGQARGRLCEVNV